MTSTLAKDIDAIRDMAQSQPSLNVDSNLLLNLIRERDEARERAERFEKLDREAATHVESVIALRTDFTGDPPYVGWEGLGLALTEALDKRDAAEAALSAARDEMVKVGIAASDALDATDAYHKHIRPEQPRIPQSVTSALYAAYQVAHKAKREAATLTKEPTDG